MKGYQDVFSRYEKKYLLSPTQYNKLRRAFEGRLLEDRYGLHTICNLYYDTDSFSLIRTSLDKPLYKEKLRLRSYGVPKPGDTVYVELKKKFAGIVYKRRAGMPLAEARGYLAGGVRPSEETQIVRELDWFLTHNAVTPRVFLAYDRIALYGAEDSELRVTFDANLRWRDERLDLTAGDRGYRLGPPGRLLMELKLPGAMPLWMSRALSDCGACPVSFSKYGACYREHLFPAAAARGGVSCA